MSGIKTQMLTAQRLGDGAALYFTAAGDWSPRFAEGRLYADAAAADAALAAAQAFVAAQLIVGPYLIETAGSQSAPQPWGTRETIRAAGNVTFAIDHGTWRAAQEGA